MKFKNSACLILICLLFVPFVLAETHSLVEDNLKIEVHPNSYDSTTEKVNLTILFSSEKYGANNQNYTLLLDVTNVTDINIKQFPFTFFTDAPIENINFTADYADCKEKLGRYDTAWTICNSELADCKEKYEGKNATSCKKDLDECTLSLKEKDLEITSKNKEIEDLKKDTKDTKNAKYLWGIGGVILGILGLLFYKGELGQAKVRDKSRGEFNLSQAG